jgi:hypothetical protein
VLELRVTIAAFDSAGEAAVAAASGAALGDATEDRGVNAAATNAGEDLLGAGIKPLPASGRVAAAPGSLLRIVSFPEASAPDEGWNETWTIACCFGASVRPGDTFENAKPDPITNTPEIVSGTSPVFASVTFRVVIESKLWEPKLREDGDSCSAAATLLPVPVSV